MEHPFIHNLSDKSLEYLQETISSLHKKLTFAYRTGNQSLINQLIMAIDSHKVEYSKKMDEAIQKQNIHTKIKIEKENE